MKRSSTAKPQGKAPRTAKAPAAKAKKPAKAAKAKTPAKAAKAKKPAKATTAKKPARSAAAKKPAKAAKPVGKAAAKPIPRNHGSGPLGSARSVLLHRRAELLGRRMALQSEEQELNAEVEIDWEDAAANKTASEALAHLSDFELAQLRRITGALERIAAGTYGRCVVCAEPIAAGRLEAMPEAPTCTECAAG